MKITAILARFGLAFSIWQLYDLLEMLRMYGVSSDPYFQRMTYAVIAIYIVIIASSVADIAFVTLFMHIQRRGRPVTFGLWLEYMLTTTIRDVWRVRRRALGFRKAAELHRARKAEAVRERKRREVRTGLEERRVPVEIIERIIREMHDAPHVGEAALRNVGATDLVARSAEGLHPEAYARVFETAFQHGAVVAKIHAEREVRAQQLRLPVDLHGAFIRAVTAGDFAQARLACDQAEDRVREQRDLEARQAELRVLEARYQAADVHKRAKADKLLEPLRAAIGNARDFGKARHAFEAALR